MSTYTKLTRRQGAIISVHTGYSMGSFSDMHKYAEEIFCDRIFSHQFGDIKFLEKLEDLSFDDWENLEDELDQETCAILCAFSNKPLGNYEANLNLLEGLFITVPSLKDRNTPEFTDVLRERVKPAWLELHDSIDCDISKKSPCQ